MVHFLKQSLSAERWKTYESLANIRDASPEELYSRNMQYSKELYVLLGGLEVVIRNSFHEQLRRAYKKEDWMSDLKLFRRQHLEQINSAIGKLTKNKPGDYKIHDLISELNFGFWIHLVDAPYEQIFWIAALRHSFRNKSGPVGRRDIEKKLTSLLKLRNKIAHLEPIIKDESKLSQYYEDGYRLMSWICPKTADWFHQQNRFKEIWNRYNAS